MQRRAYHPHRPGPLPPAPLPRWAMAAAPLCGGQLGSGAVSGRGAAQWAHRPAAAGRWSSGGIASRQASLPGPDLGLSAGYCLTRTCPVALVTPPGGALIQVGAGTASTKSGPKSPNCYRLEKMGPQAGAALCHTHSGLFVRVGAARAFEPRRSGGALAHRFRPYCGHAVPSICIAATSVTTVPAGRRLPGRGQECGAERWCPQGRAPRRPAQRTSLPSEGRLGRKEMPSRRPCSIRPPLWGIRGRRRGPEAAPEQGWRMDIR